ncbi:MAG: glycosyltransferase family 2 protein [Thalassotalea sp.]
MVDKICVLLASYNGEQYIAEQLHSLFEQTQLPTAVIISDDNSTDATWAIVEKWQNKHPELISIYKNNTDVTGHVGNFSFLCVKALEVDCEYFLFCDQDDVWLPNKIATLVKECKTVEAEKGVSYPILVHSDLMVVDSELGLIANSFFEYQGLPEPTKHALPRFLIQNVVTGCASLINKALLEKATPLPNNVVVHDWWFALIANLTGQLVFVDEPLIMYRQHSANAIGAIEATQRTNIISNVVRQLKLGSKHLYSSVKQAQQLKKALHSQSSNKLNDFLSFHKLHAKDKRYLVHQLINNPNSRVEYLSVYIVLFIVTWSRKS